VGFEWNLFGVDFAGGVILLQDVRKRDGMKNDFVELLFEFYVSVLGAVQYVYVCNYVE